MESPESSSPVITRAVAAALKGQYANPFHFNRAQTLGLRLLGYLPQAVARWLVPRVQAGATALDPRQVWELELDRLIQTRLDDYLSLPGRFPAVVAGVGLGGATAHLCAAVGGPFLPQAFVLSLQGGAPDGSVMTYFQRSAELARHLADKYPNILTIQHYDPVHDGWLTRSVNHLRFKLLDLPERYRQFLRERLEPGGEVIYLEGGASWLRYRVGERSVFQVGGWGDISAQEFLEGSERIRAYCRSIGMPQTDWRLPGYPLEPGPESEWGSEPGLRAALETFCAEENYRFTAIALPHPEDFSRLAFQAVGELLARAGRPPAGVVVETFTQYDVTAVQRSGLLPLWLIFNTHDSARFLDSMAAAFPAQKPLFFSPLATFSITPDLADWDEWTRALGGRAWINIGARRSHYPADTRALLDWNRPLRAWVEQHPNPLRGRLSGADLLALTGR